MSLPLCLEYSPQQFVIVQQFIHDSHPWLPQLSHFLCEERLPQTRLVMSHANHDTKTILNRIRLFCLGLHTPILVFTSAGSPHFAPRSRLERDGQIGVDRLPVGLAS